MQSANALLGAVLHFRPGAPSEAFCSALTLPEFSTVVQLAGRVLPVLSTVLLWAVPAVLLAFALVLCLRVPNPIRQAEHFRPSLGKLILCTVALVWSVTSFSGVSTFLYVNF